MRAFVPGHCNDRTGRGAAGARVLADLTLYDRGVDDDARWRRTTAEVAVAGLAAPVDAPAASAFDPPRDRFALGAELGRGGMGRVVAATDVALQRPVAIKQPLGGDRARFEREVRITARLEHPSIVPVHDAGRDDRGEPFYVMRRIEGEPLTAGGLAMLPHVLAAADAAAFAHARGVIHRDIKPANIVLGAHGETLLIDWGLARVLDEPDEGVACGTPGFMAPEQARGEPADARSDVYALGATLRFVLAGDAPDELAAILARALAPAPADRYRDAGELAADLRRFLTGQLVAAHRYSEWQLVARWIRRHRAGVIASAAAVIAVAVIAAFAIVNVVRERDLATAARGEAAARADQMLVERASLLATHDPAAALAVLAHLPVGSPLAPRARDVAAVAAAGGIAHGVVAHRGAVRAIELWSDGRLLSAGDDGAIRVHDLAGGGSRTVVRDGAQGGSAIWVDGGAIAFSAWRELRVVDVATGAVRVLAAGVDVDDLWRAGDRRVRYVDRARRELVERDVGGGDARVIARDVRMAAGRDRIAIVDGETELRAVTEAGEVVLARHPVQRGAWSLAVAPAARPGAPADGQVAASLDGAIVAWDARTGAEAARWAIDDPPAVVLAGPACWLASSRGVGAVLYRLCGARPVEVLRGDWGEAWARPTPAGAVIATGDGTLAVLDATDLHVVTHHKPGTHALATGAGYVALAATDGTIAWWRLAELAPPPRALDLHEEIVAADATHDYLIDHSELAVVALDHATGARRVVGRGIVFGSAVTPRGEMPVTLADAAMPPGVLDVRTGRRRALAGAILAADGATGRIVVARGGALIELGARDRTLVAAPEDLTMIAVAGDWAGALAGRRLVRIDPRGAARWLAVWAAPDALAIAHDGTLWCAFGRALWRWDGRALLPAAALPSPVTQLVATAGGMAIVLLDQSLWFATPRAVTSRLASGPPRSFAFGARVAVVTEANHRVRIALATGERTTWTVNTLQLALALGPNDLIVAETPERGGSWLTRIADPVPPWPLLHAWIPTATNARLDPATDAVTWPDATDGSPPR
jgi:hypothetical protein